MQKVLLSKLLKYHHKNPEKGSAENLGVSASRDRFAAVGRWFEVTTMAWVVKICEVGGGRRRERSVLTLGDINAPISIEQLGVLVLLMQKVPISKLLKYNNYRIFEFC